MLHSSQKYEAVIGLEIHAELSTKTKMFCRCLNDPFHSQPNSHICPVCLGLPGALPVANAAAVEATIMVGLATNCQIARQTKWDRKNYFYPDLPKGYQISQYDQPLCQHGSLTVDEQLAVAITRIHLEEDTGTLQHPAGANYSLVNYNRSGVPLLELVTEPVIRSGKEARLFAEEYQRILRALGVAKADMEKGEMRVEANISLRTRQQAEAGLFGTKVEVKNLNSFRSAEKAIDFELNRQAELLDRGEVILQETRGWHDAKQITFSQRIKEGAADYRYFPEPDLPPVVIEESQIAALTARLPLLPAARRQEYIAAGLSSADAATLVNNRALADYFEAVRAAAALPIKLVANWVINSAADQSVPAAELAKLLTMLDRGEISTKIAKDVLVEMAASGQPAAAIIAAKGWQSVIDQSAIEQLVDKVLAANPAAVAEFKAGKAAVYGFLVGQTMALAKGQADPATLNAVLKNKLQSG